MIILVFENLLEMIMCRAFHSLPPSSLEEIFGPYPEGQYSGIGLNVMPPLLQGRFLSPYSRHKVVQLLSDSPDHDIREWSLHHNYKNNQLSRSTDSEELPMRRYYDKEYYHNALYQALGNSLSPEEAPSGQDNDNIWGPLKVDTIDLQSWFISTTARLQEAEVGFGTENEIIKPIGSPDASIGIVYETTPLHDYNENGHIVSIPWGLRESGFLNSNSLIWPYDLRKYVYMPGSFQVQSSPVSQRQILRDASQELIARTGLRFIIICGDIQDVILPANAKKVELTLNNRLIRYGSRFSKRESQDCSFMHRRPSLNCGLAMEDKPTT